MQILVFAASLRKESFNRKLVKLAARVAEKEGHTIDFVDLNGYELPYYDADVEESTGFPSNAELLAKQITNASALIISTPEYNHSVPGHFKNTFDWISRLRPMPWHRKPVLLLSASPGLAGGARGLATLRNSFFAVGSYVYPDSLSLSDAAKQFTPQDELAQPKIAGNLEVLVKGFLKYAVALNQTSHVNA